MSEPGQARPLAVRCTDPVPHADEVIRAIMIADALVAERSRATGLDRAMVGEKARRCVEGGNAVHWFLGEGADLRVTPELRFDRRLRVSGGAAVTMLPYPGDRAMRRQAVRVRQARLTPSSLGATTPRDRVRTGDRACGPDKTEDAAKHGNVSAAHGAVVDQSVMTCLRNALHAER